MKKKKTDDKINQEKNDQLEVQLKRALADYQNLERRVEQEKKILSDLYSAIVIEKFLPILDNLETAQKHLNDQGLSLVIAQFKDVLSTEGVEEINAEDQEFNPKFHEAVDTIEGEKNNIVVKVVAKGYKINNRVIRPVKVVVTKAKESNIQAQENQNQEVNKFSN